MLGNPLIFLDIDGVLNNTVYFEYTKEEKATRPNFDPRCIKLLNRLCEETNAKIVITSTWRKGRSVDELQELFEKEGFNGEIIDKTRDLMGCNTDFIVRGNEIYDWIRNNPQKIGCAYFDYKKYVILDDDSDMLYCQKNNFICVDPYCGITNKTIYIAKKLLLDNVSLKNY